MHERPTENALEIVLYPRTTDTEEQTDLVRIIRGEIDGSLYVTIANKLMAGEEWGGGWGGR